MLATDAGRASRPPLPVRCVLLRRGGGPDGGECGVLPAGRDAPARTTKPGPSQAPDGVSSTSDDPQAYSPGHAIVSDTITDRAFDCSRQRFRRGCARRRAGSARRKCRVSRAFESAILIARPMPSASTSAVPSQASTPATRTRGTAPVYPAGSLQRDGPHLECVVPDCRHFFSRRSTAVTSRG